MVSTDMITDRCHKRVFTGLAALLAILLISSAPASVEARPPRGKTGKSDSSLAAVTQAGSEGSSEGSPASNLPAAEVARESGSIVSLNFQNVEIETLVKLLSEITGDAYVLEEGVAGKATLMASHPLSREEARHAIESTLSVKGFVLVREGRVVKVVSKAKSRGTGGKVFDLASADGKKSDGRGDGDEMVTHVLRLTHVSPGAVKTILGPLVSAAGSIEPHNQTSSLVVTDTAVNVDRLIKIVTLVDSPGARPKVRIFDLKYCEAVKVGASLNSILAKRSQADPAVAAAVFSLENRNSIIVAAGSEDMEAVEGIVRKLDAEAWPKTGAVRMLELKNADPEETAATLSRMFLGDKGLLSSDPRIARLTNITYDRRLRLVIVTSISAKAVEKISGVVPDLDTRVDPERGRVKVIRLSNASAESILPVLKDLFVKSDGKGEDPVRIVADKATNSIVVTASQDQFSEISETIEKLDVFRPQVLVEALIAEVSMGKLKNIGSEIGFLNPDDDTTRGGGGTNFGLRQGFASSQGLNAGVIKGNVDLLKASQGNPDEISKIRAIIHAYRNDTSFKIISTPRLLTSDNEKASIMVGQVVALPQGFARDTETGRFDLTKFEYANVGLNLDITPRINSESKVTLAVDVETKARLEENLYEFNIPVLTRRAAKTTITVADRETVVIGGLIREDKQRQESRVPYLSDIPLIGKLFRSRRNVVNRTNLLIFITPYIIRDVESLGETTRKIGSSGPAPAAAKGSAGVIERGGNANL